jgi:hypothetical protein
MIRFKQYLRESYILLEDKAEDFANRYAKVHADHPMVKENPQAAKELMKYAMQFVQNPDEATYVTRQYLDRTLKPAEDDPTIRTSLGQWRKAVSRGFTEDKKLSDFTHDDLQNFFSKYPELNLSKRVAKATTAFDPFYIGDIELPEKVKIYDESGNIKDLEPGTKLKVHHYTDTSPVTDQQRQAFREGMKKSCSPGNTWCILHDQQYLDEYSKGSGFFLYTTESGLPVLAHGYRDRGVVDAKNYVVKSSQSIAQKTAEIMPEGSKKTLHKIHSGLPISEEEQKNLLAEPDLNLKLGVLDAPEISEDVANSLATDKNTSIVAAYGRSKHLRDRHLEQYARSSNPSISIIAADNAHRLNDELFEKLLKDPTYEVSHTAANNGIGNYYDYLPRIKQILEHEDRIKDNLLSPGRVNGIVNGLSYRSNGGAYSLSPELKEIQLKLIGQGRVSDLDTVLKTSPDIDVINKVMERNKYRNTSIAYIGASLINKNPNLTREQRADLIDKMFGVTTKKTDVSSNTETKPETLETPEKMKGGSVNDKVEEIQTPKETAPAVPEKPVSIPVKAEPVEAPTISPKAVGMAKNILGHGLNLGAAIVGGAIGHKYLSQYGEDFGEWAANKALGAVPEKYKGNAADLLDKGGGVAEYAIDAFMDPTMISGVLPLAIAAGGAQDRYAQHLRDHGFSEKEISKYAYPSDD